jgi:hypothetical protein
MKKPLIADDGERLPLGDEWSTGRRVVVRDRDDGLPGVTLAVVEDQHHYLAADLHPWCMAAVADTLTGLVDRGRIEECPWCDTPGLVDGDDGPEFCGHPPPLDNG